MEPLRPVDIAAWIFFAVLLKDCQGYSWSVSVPLNISVCSNSLSNPLTLNWTYTPTSTEPLYIEWSKQETGSNFTTIATYNDGSLTPSAAYAGRVNRTGSTAEIAILGPLTAADGGVYQVAVTDSLGNTLSGFANVIFPGYSWSVSVPLNISVCSNSLSNPLTLDWTYTLATPPPLIIEWSKQGTGSTFTTIATYVAGTFTPNVRVSRTGSTAEIAIQGPLTAADGGVYQVAVTDSWGNTLSGFANVIFPAVNGPINASCVETAANVYTVTCSVDVTPPVTLQLKNGTVDLDSASSASGLSKTLSDAHNQTFQCSVTGEGSECVTRNSTDVTCISNNPTSTSTQGRPTTPTSVGICKDINCNLFLLLLLFIPIIVVIICCCRKKKKPKSNSNVMNAFEANNESVSDEVHVNNDKSD